MAQRLGEAGVGHCALAVVYKISGATRAPRRARGGGLRGQCLGAGIPEWDCNGTLASVIVD